MFDNIVLFVGGLHEVSGFILLALVVASAGIGAFSTYLYLAHKRRTCIAGGVFEVNRNDPTKDLVTLHLDALIDEIHEGQQLIFEVKEVIIKGEKNEERK